MCHINYKGELLFYFFSMFKACYNRGNHMYKNCSCEQNIWLHKKGSGYHESPKDRAPKDDLETQRFLLYLASLTYCRTSHPRMKTVLMRKERLLMKIRRMNSSIVHLPHRYGLSTILQIMRGNLYEDNKATTKERN